MADKGWIKTYRQILDCWLWTDKEPYDRRSAWMYLLLTANHSDKKIMFNGDLITVKRGQILTSIRSLAEKWKWSYDKTLRFLRLIESDGMILKDSDNFRTLITIVNYEVFQDTPNANRTEISEQISEQASQQTSEQASDKQECKECKECKEDINYCSEPKEILPSEPPVITITLNDKSEYPIYQKDIDGWKELYPAVNVMQQLRSMKGWCNSNPTKRKTSKGIKRFINNWLSKEQDKGGSYVTKGNPNSSSVLDKYLNGGK